MREKKSACPGLKNEKMKIHQSVNLQHHHLKPSGLSASEGGASGRKEKMSNGNDNKTLAEPSSILDASWRDADFMAYEIIPM